MSERVGVASRAGTLLPVTARTRGAVQRGWEPSPTKFSIRESITASAFLVFYLAAYLTAGFAGVSFIEWAWMRIFG